VPVLHATHATALGSISAVCLGASTEEQRTPSPTIRREAASWWLRIGRVRATKRAARQTVQACRFVEEFPSVSVNRCHKMAYPPSSEFHAVEIRMVHSRGKDVFYFEALGRFGCDATHFVLAQLLGMLAKLGTLTWQVFDAGLVYRLSSIVIQICKSNIFPCGLHPIPRRTPVLTCTTACQDVLVGTCLAQVLHNFEIVQYLR
jgi:hypothetical protein